MEHILASGCSITWLVKHTFGSESRGLHHPHLQSRKQFQHILGQCRICGPQRRTALSQCQRLFLGRRAACDRPWRLGSQRQHTEVVNTSDVTGYSIMPWPQGRQQFLMPLMLTVVISYQEFIFWCAVLTAFLLSIYYQLELFKKKKKICSFQHTNLKREKIHWRQKMSKCSIQRVVCHSRYISICTSPIINMCTKKHETNLKAIFFCRALKLIKSNADVELVQNRCWKAMSIS